MRRHELYLSHLPVCSLRWVVFGLMFVAAVERVTGEEFVFGNRTIRVPDGYIVEQVTTPELVERPIAVARDERGRLYVTDSGGMTERAEQQLAEKPHNIRRLEDTDGDGTYDRSTLFADRMMFPEGCLWRDGSLYVAAPPEIWKLTDTNDDGVADQREVWFNGQTLTGCGNDLHGPYAGPDGMLYWCKGAFARQEHQTILGIQPFITHASHIFRATPDGRELEPVLTGGMDNPVNVAFLSNGERFLSCTFFQFPEAGRRDGLIHAIYGGVYGKKHDSIYDHPMTGDVMPVLNHQGAAAPCGLIAESESLFGGEAGEHLLACYFNLHKVVRHRLIPDGPTYTTEDQDFVVCDHPDFHPTDVFEDANGSLLVVDTGGWYKVCCPTSQLAKPDVLGAVYRVTRRGQPRAADPLGLKLNWNSATAEELAARLTDNRLFVQRRAADQLRTMGNSSIAALAPLIRAHQEPGVRQRALWVLASVRTPEAAACVQTAFADPSSQVRQTAAHVAGMIRDASVVGGLQSLLPDTDLGVARAAAEALGRLGQPESVTSLLTAVDRLESLTANSGDGASPVMDTTGSPVTSADRVREHSLIFALMQTGKRDQLLTELKSNVNAKRSRALLVALDQGPGLGLTADVVFPFLQSPDPAVRTTAAWIVGQHPEWSAEVMPALTALLKENSTADEERLWQTAALFAQLSPASEVQQLIAQQLTGDATAQNRKVALKTMSQAGLPETPPAWVDALAGYIPQADSSELLMIFEAIRSWPMGKGVPEQLKAALLQLANESELVGGDGVDGEAGTELRIQAIGLAGPAIPLSMQMFDLLVGSLGSDQLFERRSTAAQILGTASLTDDQRMRLLAAVPGVGPMELPKLLPAFETAPSEELGLDLVKALKDSVGFRGLRADLVKPLLTKYPESVQKAGEPLVTSLNAGAAEQAAHLEKLLKELPPGDLRRGHEVFMSRKAACNTCHKLGYGGGRLGPDLTNIGRARNQRDLLEAIIYPSASIVRGYEPVSVLMNDGRIVSGIVISENRDELVISLDAQKTVTLARADVDEITPSAVSPMPNGVASLLTPQELADLVEFLRSPDR